MGHLRTSTPAPVLTPEQARTHLRIDDAGEDALLAGLIAAAEDHVARETGVALGAADHLLTLGAWPRDGVIRLPCPPLVRVDSIRYREPGGAELTLSPSGYVVDETHRPARVVLFERPPLAERPAVIRVSYVAGYEDAADVPPTLLHAVKLLVGHYYEHREATNTLTVKHVPFAVESLLLKHAMPEAV
jgi:uncharacterized phiE125 gp8 family phage protein